MISPFSLIDKVYCIHLPNKERKEKIEYEFAKFEIQTTVNYIHADPPPKNFTMSNMRRNPAGEFGVNLSHIKAVVQAIEDQAHWPLFVEDDVVFADDAEERLLKIFANMPDDWTVLYLGGHPRGRPGGKTEGQLAKKINPYIAKVDHFSCAEGYVINGRNNLHLLWTYWCDLISRNDAMYDFILSEFSHQTKGGYCAYPLVVHQRKGLSGVSQKVEDKSTIVARGWANHLGYDNITPEHLQLTKAWEEKTGRKAVQ